MKNKLILVTLLITLITVSAKATWYPCPYDTTLTCTSWSEQLVTDFIRVTENPLCTATVTYEQYTRTCTDGLGNTTTEFYINCLKFINQPCLENYLNEGGYFHADRFSEIMNKISESKSLQMANSFFLDLNNRIAYACNPNCLIGPTVMKIVYSFPFCFSICKAVDDGYTYYMHNPCSLNHCCLHYNKYCWANNQIQLCEGVYTEVDYGNDSPCDTYTPVCVPDFGTHLDTLNWVLQTPTCVYFCN